MIDKIKQFFQRSIFTNTLFIVLAITILLNMLLINFIPNYSSLGMSSIWLSFVIAFIWLIDTYVLKGVSIYDEIVKKQNIAFSIFWLGICIVVLSCVIAS